MVNTIYQNPYLNTFNAYQNQHQVYKLIPISSIEEANSTPVEFNGSPTYFHNQATNEIYIKQFDVKTGLSNLQVFSRNLTNTTPKNNINTFEKDLDIIKQKLEALEKALVVDEEIEEKPKRK